MLRHRRHLQHTKDLNQSYRTTIVLRNSKAETPEIVQDRVDNERTSNENINYNNSNRKNTMNNNTAERTDDSTHRDDIQKRNRKRYCRDKGIRVIHTGI